MFSLFRPHAELGIVFHIGTASVGAALVRFEHGKVPHVVYTLRESLPYREDVDPERFMNEMLVALKSVNDRLAKEGLAHLKFTEFGSLASARRVRHVYYIFSSPWTVTETKVVSVRENEPFALTRDQVDKIVATHEKMFETEMANGDAKALSGLKVIERKIIDIRLNGYHVSEPFGKKARSADISFLASLVPTALYEKVVDVSARAYRPKDTKAFSFALASFSVIRDAFHEESDFIFLDIGGEISDVTIVQNGLISETASFPLGRHFIARRVVKAFGGSAAEAASLIRLTEEGRADQVLQDKLKPITDKALEEWMEGFHGVLDKAIGGASLPTKIFVAVNTDMVQLFVRALRAGKAPEFGVAEAPFFVTLVNHDKLKDLVSFAKRADKDPFTAVAVAFAGRAHDGV
ncbi:MAG TPA: hypothetical protein VHD69_00135 [Candidatus Paceibacterota bacterium]|jgi:hypothetical protein|nr:hypothetical protein [Candidatus Paceibacterota bacterium]